MNQGITSEQAIKMAKNLDFTGQNIEIVKLHVKKENLND